jgi:HD-like signal output (HDOD) protein
LAPGDANEAVTPANRSEEPMTVAQPLPQDASLFASADLPPLSVTANRLLALLSDPDLDICDLAGVIDQDPPLAARIVGLANAAYFSPRNPVVNVYQAILRVLGLNFVRNLALGLVVAGSFDPRRCPGFEVRRYWFEALAVGLLAHTLAVKAPAADRPASEVYYLAGLLHNIGLLFLAHSRPQETSAAFAEKRRDPDRPMLDLFRALVGATPAEAGAWLASRWSLPLPLVEVIGAMEVPASRGDYRQPAAVVRAAARMARTCSPDDAPLPERPAGHFLGLGLDARIADAVESDFLQRCPELRALASLLA